MSNKGKIAMPEEKKEDVPRSSGPDVTARNAGTDLFPSGPQIRNKGAATASRLDTDTPFKITLALDPTQSKPSAPVLIVKDTDHQPVDVADNSWVNDLNSHEVKGQSAEEVYKQLVDVMVTYSPELDISPNAEQQCIDCVLFTDSSFEALSFKLNVFEHFGSTRFELQRHDGGALSMAKLEGEIKTLICGQSDDEQKDDDPMTMIAMDLDLPDLDMPEMDASMPMALSLDVVHESVKGNDRYCVDDLYDLYVELAKDKKMAAAVSDHDPLMATLIRTATSSDDIAVVRGCLLVLDTMCNDKETAMVLMQEYALFKQLYGMLNAQWMLIRNYVVRLMATLSALKWNMDSELAKSAQSAVRQFHGEWKESVSAAGGLIDEQTFTAIFDKLSQFN